MFASFNNTRKHFRKQLLRPILRSVPQKVLHDFLCYLFFLISKFLVFDYVQITMWFFKADFDKNVLNLVIIFQFKSPDIQTQPPYNLKPTPVIIKLLNTTAIISITVNKVKILSGHLYDRLHSTISYFVDIPYQRLS